MAVVRMCVCMHAHGSICQCVYMQLHDLIGCYKIRILAYSTRLLINELILARPLLQ